jgi:hypothetical protein
MAERRERAVFIGVAALLAGAALTGYVLLLGKPAVPSPAPPAESAAIDRLVVTAMSGPVRIWRGGAAGTALVAKVGDELRQDDVVETGSRAAVQLAAGGRYRVDLEANSEFAVKEITAELSRFRLGSGLMSARVREDVSRTFEVEAGHKAFARTRGGELSVAGDDRTATVAVRSGEAELRSGGRAVVVRAGQQSLARDGEVPSRPVPVPSSLLLKVDWPKDLVTNRRKLVVTGFTAPGAVLAVDGRSVKVEPDGSFRHVLYLREGRQTISVAGRDVAGHRIVEKSPEIQVDTHGAPAEFDTSDLWEPGLR